MFQKLIKKIKGIYHIVITYLAYIITGRPGESMIVIGVTGTKGKTSTVYTMYQVLTALGLKVGLSSSVYCSDGKTLYKNPIRNSMPGKGKIHSLMQQSKQHGATVFIVEVTSEGLAQNRHRGIHFDSVIITNLYPEHLESHGGFENYKKAKGLLFQSFERSQDKIIQGKVIQPIAWVNQDDSHQDYYRGLTHKTVQSIGKSLDSNLIMESIHSSVLGLEFIYRNRNDKKTYQVSTPILGEFMGYNLLFVIGVAHWLGFEYDKVNKVLKQLVDIPGRMNHIATNPHVFVDYAHIPEALVQVYGTINNDFKGSGKTIAILGSCGGGRDTWKRSPMGKVAGSMNDYVIVTDEDPYDENPQAIIDEVFAGVLDTGKVENKNAWRVLSRKDAIIKALDMASKEDTIIITGKGSETSIIRAHGQKEPWSDTEVVLELIK